MTSYEFEVAAKNAVIEVIREKFDEDYDISMIQFVWFAHILDNKKAILIDLGENHRLYEVTYKDPQGVLFVDVYDKKSNTMIAEIDTTVHKD